MTGTWSTWDAFRPGSGRFGWMVSPVAVVVEDDMMTPADIITIRERLGWSRRELADHVRYSKSTVAGWELGYVRPNGDAAAKLRRLRRRAAKLPPQANGDMVQCGCGRLYRAGGKCAECGCTNTPSPDDIASACEEMQRTWSEVTKEKRRRGLNGTTEELEIPLIPSEPRRKLRRHDQ